MKEYHVGQVVLSKQGRDKGTFYILARLEGENCFLVDGQTRTFAAPKKKNIKHIQGTLKDSDAIRQMLECGELPRDSDVRGFIKKLSLET